MVIGEEDNDDEVNSLFEDYSLSDWEDAYSNLLDKYDNVKRDNKHLKKKINLIVHDKSEIKKIISLELQIIELKNALNECEQDKFIISELKSENVKLLCEIDELKITMQKYLEEVNIFKEKFKVTKSVNKELQNNVEKFQKEIEEK